MESRYFLSKLKFTRVSGRITYVAQQCGERLRLARVGNLFAISFPCFEKFVYKMIGALGTFGFGMWVIVLGM